MEARASSISRSRLARPVRFATAALLFIAQAVLAQPTRADTTNAVTDWNAIAATTLVAFPPPAGGAAPALQVNLAMVQGAVYDAVNAIDSRHQPYLLETHFAPTASKQAAVATAAYRVLSSIVSSVPSNIAFPNRSSLQETLDTQYDDSLAGVADGRSKTEGIAAGDAAAAAMIAAREGDGRFGPSPWVSNNAPGHWQPQLNPDGSQILDPTPWLADVRPFLIESPSQFRTDGPRSLTSAEWAADFNEVKALGGTNSTARTPEQSHIAIWWQSNGGPAVLWNGTARELVTSNGVDIDDSALLFAKLNMASADAAISCWNDKYYWQFWRPWQAIHQADQDGNPATEPDPSWTSLITAPYPEHPSGHISLDSAILRVMQTFFGTDDMAFDVTSSQFDGETRHFDSFSQPLDEIMNARIWAGLHYRTADEQARVLGTNVFDYMEQNYFQPLT